MPSRAHNKTVSDEDHRRSINTMATASIIKPNVTFTTFIQLPALGRSFPPVTPNTISGIPIPRLNTYNEIKPKNTSPLCAINSNIPVSGAVVQGDAIRPESAPITNTPASVPPRCRVLSALRRVCQPDGNCRLIAPNIATAKSTKMAINIHKITGCCSAA